HDGPRDELDAVDVLQADREPGRLLADRLEPRAARDFVAVAVADHHHARGPAAGRALSGDPCAFEVDVVAEADADVRVAPAVDHVLHARARGADPAHAGHFPL